MSQRVLLITSMAEAENSAALLAPELGLTVEVARTHRGALAALRRRDYCVVILDDGMAEANPGVAALLWKNSGLAVPLQINFAISNSLRLAREVRAALVRREREQTLARRAATCSLEEELRSAVTGLLLQSQLALAEPAVTDKLAEKLRMVARLADGVRHSLEERNLSDLRACNLFCGSPAARSSPAAPIVSQ